MLSLEGIVYFYYYTFFLVLYVRKGQNDYIKGLLNRFLLALSKSRKLKF